MTDDTHIFWKHDTLLNYKLVLTLEKASSKNDTMKIGTSYIIDKGGLTGSQKYGKGIVQFGRRAKIVPVENDVYFSPKEDEVSRR